MIAFAEILVNPAKEAGISVPEDLEDYNPEEFVKWHVFCGAQLGQPMPDWGAHWDNAKVIAGLTDEGAKVITPAQLEAKGFRVGMSK